MELRRPPRNAAISARHLALRHARERLRALDQSTPKDPAAIDPGYEQLYSFYVAGLPARSYNIQVKQDIATADGNSSLRPSLNHKFNVIGPRFSLPEGAVYSFYPPQGHEDRGEVLPNVVLTHPTLPWERPGSNKQPKDSDGGDFSRNRVPWLAVLVFTQDELRLDASQLNKVFDGEHLQDFKKQSTTLSTNMFAKDVSTLKETITSPVVYNPQTDIAEKTEVIFLRRELFTSLFSQYSADGKRVDSPTGYVQHHRFLAHVRHIHLNGTPSAGQTESRDHAYSVIVSHRIGPLSIEKPTPVVAHLVNIEGVEITNLLENKTFVAMSSLHSWEYTCLPPNSLNIEDAFEHLGSSLKVLRPVPNEEENSLKIEHEKNPEIQKIKTRLGQRVNEGFSLVRYRVQTGDITAGFTKSPFAPSAVPFSEGAQWPPSSTTGSKLQILDPNLSIMDLTYSVAWNLGKILGLAHPEFATALGRLRKLIYDAGTDDAKRQVINRRSRELGIPRIYKTKTEVLLTLSDTIKKLKALPGDRKLQNMPNGMVHRWYRPELPPLDLSYNGREITSIVHHCFDRAAKNIASSKESDDIPYNELNLPKLPDWAVILRWVLDRYYLIDVPPHYLITDPSHLPMETVRVFAIDHNWVCAMVDGGLSLANHLDQKDDKVRTAMKRAVNKHLDTQIPGLYHPQTPRYGFYVRSALIAKFPDLIIEVEDENGDPLDAKDPPIILRHEVVEKNTMLCLMREPPKGKTLYLCLREPPHQQFFTAAAEITKDFIKMEYKRAYTVSPIPDKNHNDTILYRYPPDKNSKPGPAIFIWRDNQSDVRCLNVEAVAQHHFDIIKKTLDSGWFTEEKPTAALMGIQLNEPQWEIKIRFPTNDDSSFKDLYSDYPRFLPVPPLDTPSEPAKYSKISSTIASDPHPPFGKRRRHEPLFLTHHAPHVRLPKITSIVAGDVPALDDSGGPTFEYSVYSVGRKVEMNIPMLPHRLRQDLVFSIVCKGGSMRNRTSGWSLPYYQEAVIAGFG
ncbi:hypothetical protein EYZ11_010272 [Aspergillus tanneri]|uniref:Uncharacterized protein n=1 Tax=Aspergillus tanneri TaxID=1220188 RepID=A0A4V3UN95_9EURO|nr:hypothetical protein EYZ11_010272 [Aspergillus tanneri]